MYITVLYCCCCTGDTILPKLADVVSVSTQFHVSNIIYFFVENEFLQNSNSDYKFSRDSGTRKLCISRYSFTKTKFLMSEKYVDSYMVVTESCIKHTLVYKQQQNQLYYCFSEEVFFETYNVISYERTTKKICSRRIYFVENVGLVCWLSLMSAVYIGQVSFLYEVPSYTYTYITSRNDILSGRLSDSAAAM